MIMRMMLTLFKVIYELLYFDPLQSTRKISKIPFKVLDAPELQVSTFSLVMPGTNLLFLPTIFNHYINGI